MSSLLNRHSDPVGFWLFHAGRRWSHLLSWSDMRIVFQLPADAMHQMCIERWSIKRRECNKKKKKWIKVVQLRWYCFFSFFVWIFLISPVTHLRAVIVTFSVQPRRWYEFNNIDMSANRHQHRDANEARWRRIHRYTRRCRILQHPPQAPQRARINQMKICTRRCLHEALIICKEVKVGIFVPLVERLIKLAGIPRY